MIKKVSDLKVFRFFCLGLLIFCSSFSVAFAKDQPHLPMSVEGLLNLTSPFTLPPLRAGYGAYEKAVDAKTMEIHHKRHHQAYIDKLNAEIKALGNTKMDLRQVLKSAGSNVAFQNHGGGHFNHAFFWTLLADKPTAMPEGLKADIKRSFGTVTRFLDELTTQGAKVFGSGWVWVVRDASGKLQVVISKNQGNPMMNDSKVLPILGIDVWEHAYYLRYQNARGSYLKEILSIIDWKQVQAYNEEAKSK